MWQDDAGKDDRRTLAERLLSLQVTRAGIDEGGFKSDDQCDESASTCGRSQATAIALRGLHAFDRKGYADAIRSGVGFLERSLDGTGAIVDYPGAAPSSGDHYVGAQILETLLSLATAGAAGQ